MRELGHDRAVPRKHSGVDRASGFLWAVNIHDGLGATLEEVKQKLRRKRVLKTEYGDRMTLAEFRDMFKDIIVEEISNNVDFC